MMLDEMRDVLHGRDVPDYSDTRGKELASQYQIRPIYTQDVILAQIHGVLRVDIVNGVRYMVNELNRQMDIFMGKKPNEKRGASLIVRGNVEIAVIVPQSTPDSRMLSAQQSNQIADDFIALMKSEWPAFTYSLPPLNEDGRQYVYISYQAPTDK